MRVLSSGMMNHSLCGLALFGGLALLCISCGNKRSIQNAMSKGPAAGHVEFLQQELDRPVSGYVMVVAHRGDWYNAPENSMLAVKKAVELGADVVEVDVQKTKDGVLILMHDKTVDRTTNGFGPVSDYSLKNIRQLRLKTREGQLTKNKVPTLEEVLDYSKDKVLVNIDKADPHFEEVGQVLKRTATQGIAVIKSGLSIETLEPMMHHVQESAFAVSIAVDKRTDHVVLIEDYIAAFQPKMMLVNFQTEKSPVLNRYNYLQSKGVKLWMAPCSPAYCAGRHDDRAISGDPEGSWGWLLDQGATMLLTDHPKALIAYLEKKRRRGK